MDASRRFLQALQDRPFIPLTLAVGGLYAVYYLWVVVKKPRIHCRDKGLQRLVERHCPIAREFYWPTWWCVHTHAQTVLRAVFQTRPDIKYRSEFLAMPDGGQVKLDWADNPGSATPSSTRPTVLLLPGLTGSSDDTYVLHLVQETLRLGYRCVVFNNRGNGGAELLTSKTYCATSTEDLEFVVQKLNRQLPDAKVMGVGISLGATILLKYVMAKGAGSGLCAGMCISVCWNFHESTKSLEQLPNLHLYNKYLARALIKKLASNSNLFAEDVNLDHIYQSRTIRDFDTRFTSKMFGFDSCDHYYQESSLHDQIHSLQIPVLSLNAADDPFSPLHAIPVQEADDNNHIAMVITERGGHIGFLEGVFPGNTNYMHRWFSQFVGAVFKHGVKED